MDFEPKSAKEIGTLELIRQGIYGFSISEALDKQSKAGNEMIELKLRIIDRNGHEKLITDYLVAARAGKLRNAAEACGILAKYESGSLTAADFIGCSGRVRVGIQRDRSGGFQDRNVVVDYVANSGGQVPE
jgi:hypothetical protein